MICCRRCCCFTTSLRLSPCCTCRPFLFSCCIRLNLFVSSICFSLSNVLRTRAASVVVHFHRLLLLFGRPEKYCRQGPKFCATWVYMLQQLSARMEAALSKNLLPGVHSIAMQILTWNPIDEQISTNTLYKPCMCFCSYRMHLELRKRKFGWRKSSTFAPSHPYPTPARRRK